MRRHNDVVNIIAKYIHKAGGTAIVEPPSLDPNSRKRVDIDARMGGQHFHIDVNIIDATADSYAAHETTVLGAALLQEPKKTSKHILNARRDGATFIPYVLESLGGIGPMAKF